MLYKIRTDQRSTIDYFKIKLDRIFIFVDRATEIEFFRELNFHHFELSMRHVEQGTVSHFFFLKNVNLELIRIENQELATRYSTQSSINFVSHAQWRLNKALPFGLVLYYAVDQKLKSRRRCHHMKQEIKGGQPSSKVNFSLKNLENLEEPACYIIPESFIAENLLDSTSVIKQRLFGDRSNTSKLTDIQITLNSSISMTKTVSLISDLELINIKKGDFPQLELKFGSSNKGLSTSFDSIPVIFHY